MRTHLGRLRVPAAAGAAVALVLLGAAPASASDQNDPVGTLLDDLGHQVAQQTAQASPSPATPAAGTDSSAVPAPSDDSDSPGHETADPTPPDHGGTQQVHSDVGGNDVADVGGTKATTRDDDSTKSDSTLLALGGQEVLGAHADSRSNGESHAGDPLAPVCEGSGGQVCLEVLYADAVATDDGSASHARSRNGVANTCLGGSSADPSTGCDGPVAAGAATSRAESGRDQASGRTTASSESDLAHVCVQPDPSNGCALGADALHSEGQADSGGAKPTASRDSYLLGVTANGEDQGRVDQPTAIAVQPACAPPSLVCAYLNQGETYLGDRTAGHAQDALDARVLPDTPLQATADLGRTETLVHNDGGEAVQSGGASNGPGPQVPGAEAGGPRSPGGSGGGLAGVLPNTGGVWTGVLAAGLGALGLGALLMAAGRRRTLA